MNWFAKMIFDGGGELKNHLKSICYLSNIFKKLKNLYKILTFARYDKIGREVFRSDYSRHCIQFFFKKSKPYAVRCDTWTQLFQKIFRKNGMLIHKEGSRDTCAAILEKIPFFKKNLTFARYDKIGEEAIRAGCDTRIRLFRKIHCETKLINSRGVILIEFAVCMPILLILLFYIHDLVKIKRYYSQTEFVGQQMANIIQNISQQQASKSITQDDLKYALCLANLSMFPGTTMYTQDTNYPGYTTWVQMYRVVGAGNGKAKCTHRWELSAWNGQKPPKSIWYTCTSGDHSGSKVRYSSTAVTPSQIYPTLKMGSNDNTTEEKIIVETCLLTDSTIRPKGKSTEKQILGLNLTTPSSLVRSGQWRFYFDSVVIFSPKGGLFSASCPPAS